MGKINNKTSLQSPTMYRRTKHLIESEHSGSANFRLPELNNYDLKEEGNKSINTFRHDSVKYRARDASQGKPLTNKMIYSGTMGRIKNNLKKHLIYMEKNNQKSPTMNSMKSRTFESNNDESAQPEEPEVQARISIDIEKLKDAFKKNPAVQK